MASNEWYDTFSLSLSLGLWLCILGWLTRRLENKELQGMLQNENIDREK